MIYCLHDIINPDTCQVKSENIGNSMHDNCVKENAKLHDKAGLDTYLVRDAGGGCCPWCAAIAGRYKYADAPDDVFRRHDNCTCTTTYECGRLVMHTPAEAKELEDKILGKVNNKSVDIQEKTVYDEYKLNRMKIQETLHNVEEKRRTLDYEVGTIIDREGNVVEEIGGEAHSASAFFEETIHYAQIQKYGVMDAADFVERDAREIAANRKLLRNGKSYGFTKADFEDVKNNLVHWENDFKRRVGVSYDESDINREI